MFKASNLKHRFRPPTPLHRRSSLIKDVERDVDEEGRTERSALIGFITAKIVGEQVREVTRGMEEKTKGEVKRGGEDWTQVERKARRR